MYDLYGDGKSEYEGKTLLVVGHREGERDLFALYYNKDTNSYDRIDIDTNVGVANVSGIFKDDKLSLIACHRETDQVISEARKQGVNKFVTEFRYLGNENYLEDVRHQNTFIRERLNKYF